MILTLDRDGILTAFSTLSDAQKGLECIDVAGEEYELIDGDGRRVDALITRAVTTFHPGAFELRICGNADPARLRAILARAVRYEPSAPSGLPLTLADLRACLRVE
jgi:hypothetical protein